MEPVVRAGHVVEIHDKIRNKLSLFHNRKLGLEREGDQLSLLQGDVHRGRISGDGLSLDGNGTPGFVRSSHRH